MAVGICCLFSYPHIVIDEIMKSESNHKSVWFQKTPSISMFVFLIWKQSIFLLFEKSI